MQVVNNVLLIVRPSMMIKVYFTKNDQEWSTDRLSKMLLPLPDSILNKILVYKDRRDRQSRVLGKWLLLRLIGHFNLELTLADLKYTEFNKPYFSDLSFSTAHSGEMVVCAGAINGDIGVDIEQVMPIELENYREHLTKNEWVQIENSADQQRTFYKIWTKKEALLKAIGRGVDIEFDTLDVCGDKVNYQGKNFSFCPLSIVEDYICYVAISDPFYNESIFTEAVQF